MLGKTRRKLVTLPPDLAQEIVRLKGADLDNKRYGMPPNSASEVMRRLIVAALESRGM